MGKKDGINPWLALGGVALLNHLINGNANNNLRNIYVDDDRELREQEKILEKQQRVLEKQKEIEKEKNPNNIEYIKERVDEGCNVVLWGIGCFLAFDFAFLMGIEGTSDPLGLLGCIVCIIVGIMLLKKCFKVNSIKKKYMEYISIIIVQGERSIVNIANEMHKSYDEAYKDILYILSKNFIKGYHIDKKSRMIISSNQNMNIDSKVSIDTSTVNIKKQNKCQSCGSDVFVESHGEYYCKYCGTKI